MSGRDRFLPAETQLCSRCWSSAQQPLKLWSLKVFQSFCFGKFLDITISMVVY